MKISKSVNIDFNTITTIIFDWGGVITNIYPKASIAAFSKLGHRSFQKYFHAGPDDDLFLRFEKGEAQNNEIFERLREEIGKPVPDEKLNKALCAMLLDTPDERLKIISELGKDFRLILLSNTNPIHTDYYNKYLMEKHNVNFPALFDHVYYSYKIGLRKPDPEIFSYVLDHDKLDENKTLFIDDTEINITAARSLNIQCLHLNHGLTIEDIFSE